MRYGLLCTLLMSSALWAQKMPQIKPKMDAPAAAKKAVPRVPPAVAPSAAPAPQEPVAPAPVAKASPAKTDAESKPASADKPLPEEKPVAQEKAASPEKVAPADLNQGPEVQRSSDLLAGIIEDYIYEGNDRRDPFLPFESGRSAGEMTGPTFPLQKFDLDQLRLAGIIWSVKKPKALIIDPTGKNYTVTLNDRMGRNNGYVARIREGELLVVESFSDAEGRVSYQTKVLKLNTDQ